MGDLLDAAPIAAAAFAIPQFLPQLLKLRRTHDTAGVSWPWAALTSVNNAAWLAYFVLSAYWAALVPASSATLLAGTLAALLARRGQAKTRPVVLIGAWAALLAAAFAVAGRTGLGALLTAAFAHGYEEPTLRRQFGAQNQAYRRAVPAWWPRRRPWQPGQAARHQR
jgi:uncharacterized protein with PQ loop repeat